MPMLVVCTLITANLFDSKETEKRVDGDGSAEGEDGGVPDG